MNKRDITTHYLVTKFPCITPVMIPIWAQLEQPSVYVTSILQHSCILNHHLQGEHDWRKLFIFFSQHSIRLLLLWYLQMDWMCVYIYIYNHPKINQFPEKSHMLSNSGSSFVSQQKMCEKIVVYNWQRTTASARPQLLQLLWLLDTTLLATSFCHPSEKGTGEPDGRSDLELRNLNRSFNSASIWDGWVLPWKSVKNSPSPTSPA